nr:TrmJ/YjtD family RNA methyltransferase [Candidatus Krumholzibacteria bacterium]
MRDDRIDSAAPGIADQRGTADLDNIIVVLSHTTEPMNIGATCRAMKTMGLKHLRLINPLNPKGRTARSLAHGSEDILDNAVVCESVVEAVGDALLVAGTTARPRKLRKQSHLEPSVLAEHLVDHSRSGKVALLFGTERSGLTNDEVDLCRYLSSVDTAPEHGSLNLSQAVMLYGWEIRQAWRKAGEEDVAASVPAVPATENVRRPEMRVRHPHRSTRLPSQLELNNMYGHIAAVMDAVDYQPGEKLKFMTYLRQLHMRAGIVNWETHIYHILCRKVLRALGQEPFPGVNEEWELD